MGLVLYPYFLIVFWYKDFLFGTIKSSYATWIYVANLLSAPLLIKTFFRPLKNEYREGLVLFSVIMGIIIKSLLFVPITGILLIALILLAAIDLVVLILPFLIFKLIFL